MPSASADHDLDPVCIVGVGCRLPGDIHSMSDFWDLLIQSKSASGPVPADRFNIEGYYQESSDHRGVLNANGGYFLREDVRQFDNTFFEINNLEATYLDPQQRKLLEVVYECIEDAGTSLEKISGTNTGVFVGNFTYDHLVRQTRDLEELHRYTTVGVGATLLANRISHVFNLRGPSFALDTACSSSLYSLHAAVSAIKAGDCDTAIVAAANMITSPEQHMMILKSGVLSPNSACRTFDESADGYGRADGVNAVYLKRLSQALQDNNKIVAVIRGTAINANGRTKGITLPSATMQEAVIRKAYANAGLEPADTDYVECHGTGTAVGDPIEVDAIGRVFSSRGDRPLLIGSVKTNVGHSEAASGLTSIIKVALAFEHNLIPPTYGITKLNPKLRLDEFNMEVVREAKAWPRSIRRAGINGFGYGGANAHVIIESLDTYHERTVEGADAPVATSNGIRWAVLPISAASDESLTRRHEQIRQVVTEGDASTLHELVLNLAHRSSFKKRSFLLASAEPTGNNTVQPLWDVQAEMLNQLPFAFAFTGQGAQYAGMAKDLMINSCAFAKSIRAMDDILKSLPSELAPSWTIEDTIMEAAETSRINDVERSQPVCTAIQVALTDILRDWGVVPKAVVGHSSGEIAASYAAALLNQEQALLAAYFRGYALGQSTSRGAMLVAGLSSSACEEFIRTHELQDKVDIACVNAPDSTTLSGSKEGIDIIHSELQRLSKFNRKLSTGGRAYHSFMMKDIGKIYEEILEQHGRYSQPSTKESKIKMFSSVASREKPRSEVGHSTNFSQYWRDNLQSTVQFQAAIEDLHASGEYRIIEIGPHSALKGPMKQTFAAKNLTQSPMHYCPTLLRGENAHLCLQTLAGALFMHGYQLDWRQVNELSPSSVPKPINNIPPYPWDYSAGLRWHESRPSYELRNRPYLRHELLGTQQLAGNGIDWAWRNIFRPSEAPWLGDHRVEGQIVFPAVAYLSLAMEALRQIQKLKLPISESKLSFEFRNVNIKTAMVLSEEDDGPGAVEIHTVMSSRKLSTAISSADWQDFSVSSITKGNATVHCSGTVRIVESPESFEPVLKSHTEAFETTPVARWYDILEKGGLPFGPQFQSLASLKVDTNRDAPESLATTRLRPPAMDMKGSEYGIHPITMDACLQATIIAGAKGDLTSVESYLPVFISSCIISPHENEMRDEDGIIHARSSQTGVGTRRGYSTLHTSEGFPLVELRGVRLARYGQARSKTIESDAEELKRHPCLRARWKPDILRLMPSSDSDLRRYIEDYKPQIPDCNTTAFEALVDLMGHKNPRMRVLDISHESSEHLQQMLDSNTAFPRYRSWHHAAITDDSSVSIADDDQSLFDLILVLTRSTINESRKTLFDQLVPRLSSNGMLITHKCDATSVTLSDAQLRVVDAGDDTIFAVRNAGEKWLQRRHEVLLIFREPSPVVTQLLACLTTHFTGMAEVTHVSSVQMAEIESRNINDDTLCVSLLELEHEYLATMTPQEMDLLLYITNRSKNLVWLTGTDMLGRSNPDLTLSGGLFRSLVLEQPSLRCSILDIGATDTLETRTGSICSSLDQVLLTHFDKDDREFVLHQGLLQITRYEPDVKVNSIFRRRYDNQAETVQKSRLAEVSPATLRMGKPGLVDSLHYQQLRLPDTRPPAGFIDIEVQTVSVNAKDVYGMMGRLETGHGAQGATSHEFAGIIKAIGPGEVGDLKPGDRVVVVARCHFSTVERVPARCAYKLLPTEDSGTMSTLPIAYVTALYALHDRAHLRAGESLLVHSGAGALGMAVITIAKQIGATVFATAGSPAKRAFLVKEFGIPDSHIFSSRDASFAVKIREVTRGRGVDVVINSLTGDLLHASWDCIARFGRFVELGKQDLADAGKLDMHRFLESTTFTAFDLADLIDTDDQYYRDNMISKVNSTLDMFRQGLIKVGPIATYEAGEVSQAFRHFSSRDRIGKVVVSFENTNALVPAALPKYETLFDPGKSYLLVGCLGGLGRSLSSWMVDRGARNLVFLSRSGTDRQQAQELVDRLRRRGVHVSVVRGDVTRLEDVVQAVQECNSNGRQLGGVIHGAMGLREAIFSRMTNEMWHIGIQPKWSGTWNLHHALEGQDSALDFFLLMSSVSGSIGIATETNYCASNGFQDAFAHWRRCQGKTAVSVGLGMVSEVGYLHENPEIEAVLLRRGIHPINEQEFLQVIDLALTAPAAEEDHTLTGPGTAHLLTGLELSSAFRLMHQGFEVNHTTMEDARASRLAAALEAGQRAITSRNKDAKEGQLRIKGAPEWLKEVPAALKTLFASEADAASVHEAALRIARKQFSNLLLLQVSQLDDSMPLARYGVDSMIASEFKTWLWATFKVDIPLLHLMSEDKCLRDLADAIVITFSSST